MTLAIGLLLTVLLVALVLFSIDWFPTDAVALGVLLALILLGLLEPKEAFSGFGSETVMMLLGLLILTAALARTGVIDAAGRILLRHTGENVLILKVLAVLSVAALSGFMSNTAATAVFVPIVIGLARRLKTSPSKLLMPIAFASILSSSLTLIATSTNLVVSGLLVQQGLPGIGMFELTPAGLAISLVGIAYLLTIGARLIPARAPVEGPGAQLTRKPFLTEVVVLPDSPLVGTPLGVTPLGRDLDLAVLEIIRDGKHLAVSDEVPLSAGDLLLIEGEREEILQVKDTAGIDIKADAHLADPEVKSEELQLVEAIVLDRSPLPGRTLHQLQFRHRYGVQVLGINRHGETIRRKLSRTPLRLGDVLLLQGRAHEIAGLQDRGLFRIFSAVNGERPNWARAWTALAAFAGAILAVAFNLLELPVAVLLGAVIVFVTGCIRPEEAYRDLDWRIVILIGCMLGLGAAMQKTGAAQYLAGLIAEYAADAGTTVLLTGFFVLTVLLTQPMSNQAAAVVVVPIAIQTAVQLGLNPRTFVMMVAIAASCSYLTPLEPSCLMVYGPGEYRFRDFLKVGGMLTVLVYLIAVILVPILWPPNAG